MKKLFSFVLGLLLFFCPLAAQAEDVAPMPQEGIVEAPSPDPMSDEAIRYLQGEDMYPVSYTHLTLPTIYSV